MNLHGKTAIVTGAATGIGNAIAKRFAKEGMTVILADNDQERGEKAADELGAAAGHAIFIKADVSRKLDVHNLVASAIDQLGKIDVLVNNAGIIHAAEFLDLKLEDFDRVIGVNLRGSFLMGQAVARHMVERAKSGEAPGAIINLSSINAVVTIANQAPYSISKGGINQLTKVMALSLAPYGIRVNAIGPGSIATEMMSTVASDEAAKMRIASRTPLGRMGEPSEIAAIAAFLASDESSYVTGQTIYADGGRLALNYTMPVKAK